MMTSIKHDKRYIKPAIIVSVLAKKKKTRGGIGGAYSKGDAYF